MEIPKEVDIATENSAEGQHACDDVHTIAPGSTALVSFFVWNFGHPPKDIEVLPYGSNVGRMVWTVADCPVGPPKTCFGQIE